MNLEMNEFPSGTEQDRSKSIDLLVDGELSDGDRRALILRLEREPDGWRRCALAFLEAQSWRRQFGELTEEPAHTCSPACPVLPAPLARRTWWRGHLGGMLAVAASFVFALALGLSLDNLSGMLTFVPPSDESIAQVGRGAQVTGDATNTNPAADEPFDHSDPSMVASEMLNLVVHGTDPTGPQRIQMPVHSASHLPEDWLRTPPAVVSPEVREELERLGHTVRQRRQLWPFLLDDGRRVVVPVDQLEVAPVRFNSYQ